MTEQERDIPWGAVAFLFVLVGGLLLFVFLVGNPGGSHPEAEDSGEAGSKILALEQYWARVSPGAPDYTSRVSACPVDGTDVAVPNSPTDNRAGGVTTDLMKIAIHRADDGSNKPLLDLQDFQQKLATCPTCGATYLAVDLSFILGGGLQGGSEKIRDWDLDEEVPGLDLSTESQWTYDTRSYLRYRTQLKAGYPDYEAAFAALAGAYCTNFEIWFGEEYAIPSPALYALAAARLREDLELNLPEPPAARSSSAMVLGELYRLLGRADDAEHWYAEARNIGDLNSGVELVLEFMEDRLAEGDYSLHRIPDRENMEIPPFGWQVDLLLPAINGHIEQFRGDWADYDNAEEIENHINELLVGSYGE